MKTQTSNEQQEPNTFELPKEIKECVDALIAIEQRLDINKARLDIRASDELKRKIKQWVSDQGYAHDQPVIIEGYNGFVEFRPCDIERVVEDKSKLKRLLGAKLYDELAKFSMKDLEKHLSKQQIESVVQPYYGSRKLKGYVVKFVPTVH